MGGYQDAVASRPLSKMLFNLTSANGCSLVAPAVLNFAGSASVVFGGATQTLPMADDHHQ